jgi:hypothetical protein
MMAKAVGISASSVQRRQRRKWRCNSRLGKLSAERAENLGWAMVSRVVRVAQETDL